MGTRMPGEIFVHKIGSGKAAAGQSGETLSPFRLPNAGRGGITEGVGEGG
jgi:hypothetical protein